MEKNDATLGNRSFLDISKELIICKRKMKGIYGFKRKHEKALVG